MDQLYSKIPKRLGIGQVGNSDRVSGLVLCFVSVLALFASRDLPFGTITAPDAGFFPRILSTFLLFLGAGICVRSFKGSARGVSFGLGAFSVMIVALTLCTYPFVLNFAGFVLSTIPVLVLLMRGCGGMSWTASTLISASSVLLSYLLFVRLGLPLPQGPLLF